MLDMLESAWSAVTASRGQGAPVQASAWRITGGRSLPRRVRQEPAGGQRMGDVGRRRAAFRCARCRLGCAGLAVRASRSFLSSSRTEFNPWPWMNCIT